jgi:hypothetical protein
MQHFYCFKQVYISYWLECSPCHIIGLLQGSPLLQMLHFLVVLHQLVLYPKHNIQIQKYEKKAPAIQVMLKKLNIYHIFEERIFHSVNYPINTPVGQRRNWFCRGKENLN